MADARAMEQRGAMISPVDWETNAGTNYCAEIKTTPWACCVVRKVIGGGVGEFRAHGEGKV